MTVELAIVGAGPAGMAAAVLGAQLGLEIAIVDEQHTPGARSIVRSSTPNPAGRSAAITSRAGRSSRRSEPAR
jgi:flavin-dependent dehydrogenase